jgi:tRNA(adenine34) deaminase
MTDEYFMMLALKEAKLAYDEDEIPIGAVVVLNDRVIARGHNMTEKLNDPTAHAEMIALTSAFSYVGGKYLPQGIFICNHRALPDVCRELCIGAN